MTTEEERKAAAEKVDRLSVESTMECYVAVAIDLQCALTRTEKENAELRGMLSRIAAADETMGWMDDVCLCVKTVAAEYRALLNPPAEGE